MLKFVLRSVGIIRYIYLYGAPSAQRSLHCSRVCGGLDVLKLILQAEVVPQLEPMTFSCNRETLPLNSRL